ncbi:serine hydrolase domain-containing protein [Luteimonas sp. RIT-PG2_3]
MDAFLSDATGAAGYPGAVALVEVDGQPVFHGAWGRRDAVGHQPMAEDAIFRIYSMTKPVTSVAVLMLLEQGLLTLDDPVSRHLPEFADIRMVAGGSSERPELQPLPRPLTIRHLLSHTSGLAADTSAHPVAAALLREAGIDGAADLTEVARRLARVPLAEAPGTHFHYEGSNTELLARIVEVVSGQPFGQWLQAHVFVPLDMRDTGFEVPTNARNRVVDLVQSTDDGGLRIADTASARTPGIRLKAYDNAAGGLYSTARDYMRFARMLVNNGEVDGVRLLSRKSIDLMMSDQLARFDPAIRGETRGEGFGLGGYVVTDPAMRGRLGSEGQFGWSGAASTYFTVDRRERMVAILLLQYLPGHGRQDLPKLSAPFYNLVYQALP